MSRLTLDRLAVTLGRRQVLAGVSLDLPSGALIAIVGPNGAGKTSLLRAVAGLVAATGDVHLDGESLNALAATERARRVAYLPQRADIAWALSVRDAVMLGRLPHGDPFAGATPADAAAVARALSRLSLYAFAGRPVTELSGGERARVMLARVLATEAPLLLADEPIAALDPAQQIAALELLGSLAAEGRTVLAVLHDLTLAARYADHVVVLDQGRVAASGPPAEALSDAILADVFALSCIRVDMGGRMVPLPHTRR